MAKIPGPVSSHSPGPVESSFKLIAHADVGFENAFGQKPFATFSQLETKLSGNNEILNEKIEPGLVRGLPCVFLILNLKIYLSVQK